MFPNFSDLIKYKEDDPGLWGFLFIQPSKNIPVHILLPFVSAATLARPVSPLSEATVLPPTLLCLHSTLTPLVSSPQQPVIILLTLWIGASPPPSLGLCTCSALSLELSDLPPSCGTSFRSLLQRHLPRWHFPGQPVWWSVTPNPPCTLCPSLFFFSPNTYHYLSWSTCLSIYLFFCLSSPLEYKFHKGKNGASRVAQ